MAALLPSYVCLVGEDAPIIMSERRGKSSSPLHIRLRMKRGLYVEKVDLKAAGGLCNEFMINGSSRAVENLETIARKTLVVGCWRWWWRWH